MDVAGSELDFFKQKVSQLTGDLSRALDNLNRLMEDNAGNIAGTLGNLNSVTGDMAQILSAEKNNLKSALENLSKFSDMLGDNAQRVDSIIGNVDRVHRAVLRREVRRQAFADRRSISTIWWPASRRARARSGKLMNDPRTVRFAQPGQRESLAALLADVKQYPGRYVHLSLFGRNPEKMKERADRKAAKAAEKAERDSLRRLR